MGRGDEIPKRLWIPEIVATIAKFMSPNDIACSLKLVDKSCATLFRGHKIIKLSLAAPHSVFTERWDRPGVLRSFTSARRRDFLRKVAASGSIKNMQAAIRIAGLSLTSCLIDAAARAGHLQLCLWLRDRGCPVADCRAVEAAAAGGHLSICRQLLSHGFPWHNSAIYAALAAGHVNIAEALMEPLLPDALWLIGLSKGEVCRAAAEGCSLSDLKELTAFVKAIPMRSIGEWEYAAALEHAAASPTPDWREKVEWLESLEDWHEQLRWLDGPAGMLRKPGAAAAAAARLEDGLERLRWLRARGYAFDSGVLAAAARVGNLPALQYLLSQVGVEVDDSVTIAWAAAQRGHLAVLQLLHARGCPLEPHYVVNAAAAGGHLPVVAWLVETFELPVGLLERMVMAPAIRSGNVELLAWLRGRGCTVCDIIAAMDAGCEEALDWIAEHGDRDDEYSCGAYIQAAANGDLTSLRQLRRLGYNMVLQGDAFRRRDPGSPYTPAGRGGMVDVLRCLRDELQYPWTPNAQIFTAWVAGAFPLSSLTWLLEEAACPVDWQAAAAAAGSVQSTRQPPENDWLRAQRWPQEENLVEWLEAQRQRREQGAAAAAEPAAAVGQQPQAEQEAGAEQGAAAEAKGV